MRSMDRELERLRKGEISFAAFAASTSEDFDRMSKDIIRRWKVPPGVDQEDVRQELLTASADAVKTWDESRGPTLARYVVWHSYVAGKRFVHRQRGAARRDGKAASRFPVAFSTMVRVETMTKDHADLGLEGVTEPTQEEQVASRQLADGFRLLLGSPEERAAFDVLVSFGGNADAAAAAIDREPRLAMRCRVGSAEEAAELVDRTLENTRRLVREVLAA